ncbi:putative 2-(R)-hydroxypropyl-CoM dehydrogenase [Halenospora varia]|nr:putative 2-(R)-hydroxypropyl-CoM dehydrogenase [Halenospora varia]
MPPPKGSQNFLEAPGDYDVTKIVHNDSYPAIDPTLLPATNKSVLIVGASKGIGRAIAISFARSGASQIAIAARSSLESLQDEIVAAASKANRAEPQVLCVKLDVTSKESTEEAAKYVEKEFGKLDIVIINAGVLIKNDMVADFDPEIWWETLNVNLKGPFLISRAFLPLLLKGGDKTIVTTSSCGAHLKSPGASPYQISKLAVVRLMEFVATEYGDKGVSAFSIHPGNVITPLLLNLTGGEEGLKNSGMAHIFVETPELAGDTLAFLTREKRQWLSGRYVNVTWDMPELMAKEKTIVEGDKLKVKFDY